MSPSSQFILFHFADIKKVSLFLYWLYKKFFFSPWNLSFVQTLLSTSPHLSFRSHHLCLLFAFYSWLKCTIWPLRLTLLSPLPNLLFPRSFYASLPSLSRLFSFFPWIPFSRSVLRGWGQWRMARVAMTTPEASTARMASMADASSCVSSSSYLSKMTLVPAMCSCFVGENNQL